MYKYSYYSTLGEEKRKKKKKECFLFLGHFKYSY